MKMESRSIVNGVDVQAVTDTVKAIEGQPDLAKFKFRLTNKWETWGLNRSTVGPFYGAMQENMHLDKYVMVADEPELMAATDKAPTPVEHLLHALASCVTSSIVYHAAMKGIEIRAIESELEGDLDVRGLLGLSDEEPRGYRSVQMVLQIDTDEKDMGRFEEFARFSPVYSSIKDSVNVEIAIRRMAHKKRKAA